MFAALSALICDRDSSVMMRKVNLKRGEDCSDMKRNDDGGGGSSL